MPDVVRKVDYYYLEIADARGEGFRVLGDLKRERVNFLAGCGFPIRGRKSQLDLVPEDPKALRAAAAKLKLRLSARKRAFLVQGEDRVGAVADIFEKLAAGKINIHASQALSAGDGRWGMMLWVKPQDYAKASKALGAV